MIKLTITHDCDSTQLRVRTGDGNPVPIRTLLNIISEVENGLLAIAIPAQPLRADTGNTVGTGKEAPSD